MPAGPPRAVRACTRRRGILGLISSAPRVDWLVDWSAGQLWDLLTLGFGGAFCLVWASGRWLSRAPEGRRVGAAFIGISGIRLIWEAFFLSTAALEAPRLFAVPLPFTYLIGPTVFLYYAHLLGRADLKLRMLHFLPALLSVGGVACWLLVDPTTLNQLLARLLAGMPGPRSPAERALLAWVVGPKVSILAYAIAIPLFDRRAGLRALADLAPPLRRFAWLLLLYVYAMIACDIAGYLFARPVLFRGSAWSHSFAAIGVYLFTIRHPGALLDIGRAIETVRYARSKLNGVDVDRVVKRLEELMRDEHAYADEDLRLAGLAEACAVSPHQLSQILNERLHATFTNFVNDYRVEAARALLLEEPERSVLSIALAVGFNSKSAFNRAFQRRYRQTPNAVRREFLRSKL